LQQFKSIKKCEVALGPVTILAGRNGAGKSNILDGLRFVADALRDPLDQALRLRGGLAEVRRRQLRSRPTNPKFRVVLNLGGGCKAHFGFDLVANAGAFTIRERCAIEAESGHVASYKVDDGVAEWTLPGAPPVASKDRLYLVSVSGLPEFRPVFDALTRMSFHNLNAKAIKFPSPPASADALAYDGANLSSVIKRLEPHGADLDRAIRYMNAMGIPIHTIRHKQIGPYETFAIAHRVDGGDPERESTFDAISLSDGTVRALAILVSLIAPSGPSGARPTLVAIEEPETALHPAAAGALMDAIVEGSERTQVVVTCHSPDLLDQPKVTPEMIRAVVMEDGCTWVGGLSPARADLLRRSLCTAGELLRQDQLEPDDADLASQKRSGGVRDDDPGSAGDDE
jgi:predicted ATPase